MRRMIFAFTLLGLALGVQIADAAAPADGMISPAQIRAMAREGETNQTSDMTPNKMEDEPEHDTIFPMEEEYGDDMAAPGLLVRSGKSVSVDGSPRSVEPLDHFLRTAFQERVEQFALLQSGTGFEAAPGILVRWDKAEIAYAVENEAGKEQAAIVDDALAELSTILDERDVSLVLRDHVPDIAIRIGSNPEAEGQTGQTRTLEDRATGAIRRAEVQLFVQTLTPAAARRHLLLALGLQGWAEPGADSVLWFPVAGVAPSERETLSPIDKEALRLLYHPALAPGMTMEQTLAALDENAPEVDVPDVPGVTAPAYEPRIRPDLREKERRRRGESR